MPNWAQNTLTLTHPDPAQIKRVEDAVARGELLNEFVPVPNELINSTVDTSTDQGIELSRQLIADHGYDNAYDWCVNTWGTKWDVDAEVIMATDTDIDIGFDSAWSPPIGWYERMMDLGFTVDAYYYESGMGFCGHWSDGSDDYYEVGETSAETQANIPSDIDDMFSISESQYEWEQENRDELQAWIEDAVEAKEGEQ
jgi:hypothetical protein